MSTSFKTSMFGGFDRSDVIAYIERTGREHEERVAALEAENETLRKENQTLENTQRVTQAQLLNMRDNEETCRRLRRQLADAEARNQELEQRCAQLKVQADEYESLKGPCGPDRDQRPPPHGAVPGGGRDPAAAAGGPAAGVVPHGAGGL